MLIFLAVLVLVWHDVVLLSVCQGTTKIKVSRGEQNIIFRGGRYTHRTLAFRCFSVPDRGIQ